MKIRRDENAEIASLEGSKRPTIYICIEQKNREYDEKLLLAAELTLKGYRCYIGTHAAIWALLRVKNEQSGIYFDKGTQLPIIMNWIKTKCKYLYVSKNFKFGNKRQGSIETLRKYEKVYKFKTIVTQVASA